MVESLELKSCDYFTVAVYSSGLRIRCRNTDQSERTGFPNFLKGFPASVTPIRSADAKPKIIKRFNKWMRLAVKTFQGKKRCTFLDNEFEVRIIFTNFKVIKIF